MFVVAMPVEGYAEGIHLPSKWDQDILNMEFRGVRIQFNNMQEAWLGIGCKYLVRANLYMDTYSDTDLKQFIFTKETATGKELIEAFLATFTAYTYTQDRDTGVVWIHSKKIKYEDMLSQKISIVRPAFQVPVLNQVILPLCGLLSIELNESAQPGPSFNYAVDLPTGVYTFREIINFCCVANPSKAFNVAPAYTKGFQIILNSLSYRNPLAPPRDAAVKFWEIEIGKSTNGIPSASEVSAGMGDANPRKRWAARAYLEAANINYRKNDIVDKSGSPEKAVWAALGIEAANSRGIGAPLFLVANVGKGFTNNFAQIRDPSLALVTSLELTREKQDTGYLDAIVKKHQFSEAEITSIKSDTYRLAHESKLVIDKLKALKLDVPEFSSEALRELENTNLFILVPAEKK